jgi:hypothetical protein
MSYSRDYWIARVISYYYNILMPSIFSELNDDQLDGLAKLCFDLAKGVFAFILLPVATYFQDPLLSLFKMFFALVAGLAFTYVALLILKLKEYVE